jgi:hypothetical protein
VLVAQALWGLLAARHGAGLAWMRGKLEGLRQFRAMQPTGGGTGQDGIGGIVDESERELLVLQRQTGFDLFWRLYFALT